MSIAEYIDRKRVLVLKSKTRKGAISELVRAIVRDDRRLQAAPILDALWKREALLSTRIAPGIAIPHAQIPGMEGTIIAVGKSVNGISYDARDDSDVHLVFLIISGERSHLKALGTVAALLQNRDMTARLMAAEDKNTLLSILQRTQTGQAAEAPASGLSMTLARQAVLLARHIQAAVVIVHQPSTAIRDALVDQTAPPRIIYAGGSGSGDWTLTVPFRGLNRAGHLEISLLIALSEGLVRKGETVVSVFGLSDEGQPDTIVVTDVDKDFTKFFPFALDAAGDAYGRQTFFRVLQLAIELADEGREGKPVGAIFVIGDDDHVTTHCQQMVINPFKGYDDHEKNILDPGLAETIKEFAHIDGAFIIRSDGVIISAGTYLRVDHPSSLPSGLGARHAAAAGITAVTRATAIVISESTRAVSLFRGGKRIMIV
jgi:diadenylate cyclase